MSLVRKTVPHANFAHALTHARPTMSHIPLVYSALPCCLRLIYCPATTIAIYQKLVHIFVTCADGFPKFSSAADPALYPAVCHRVAGPGNWEAIGSILHECYGANGSCSRKCEPSRAETHHVFERLISC